MKFSILAILALSLFAAAAPAADYTPAAGVEQKYAADGPWAIYTIATSQACDREGNVCDIWFPTELSTNPIRGLQRALSAQCGRACHGLVGEGNEPQIPSETAEPVSLF